MNNVRCFGNQFYDGIPSDESSFNPPDSGKIPAGLLRKTVENEQTIKKSWHERAITYLDSKESLLDKKMPNFLFQTRLDYIGNYIESQFAPLEAFNSWLDSNGQGRWYKQLAIFLGKLPIRAVRNIIRLLYNFIKGAIFAAVHPLKALNHLAKLFINLIHELTKPETWSKMGIGMMGASLGQALITGNPLSVIGLGIGAALLIAGLSVGALKAAIQAEKGSKLKAAKQNLFFQAEQLPEAALTGFCMGLLIGGIQRAVYADKMRTFQVSNYDEAKRYADTFIKEHKFPQYSRVELDPSGKIIIKWEDSQLYNVTRAHPEFFPKLANYYSTHQNLVIQLQPGGHGEACATMRTVAYTQKSYSYYPRPTVSYPTYKTPLGIGERLYPLPPPISTGGGFIVGAGGAVVDAEEFR